VTQSGDPNSLPDYNEEEHQIHTLDEEDDGNQ